MFARLLLPSWSCLSLPLAAGATPEEGSALVQLSVGSLKGLHGGKVHSLADRIAAATEPAAAAAEACGGLDATWSRGDGAAYAWCRKVLDKATPNPELVGLSYGIFTWDSWSQGLANDYGVSTRLFDCYSTTTNTKPLEGFKVPYHREDVCVAGHASTDQEGRHFEALQDHLAERPAAGTLVKLDVEGSEWEALLETSDEQLRKVDLLDLEFHLCLQTPPSEQEMKQRVATLERLTSMFLVTGRAPADATLYNGRMDAEICGQVADGNPSYPRMFSISYVNKARLQA